MKFTRFSLDIFYCNPKNRRKIHSARNEGGIIFVSLFLTSYTRTKNTSFIIRGFTRSFKIQ